MANEIPWDDPLQVLDMLLKNEQLLFDLQALKNKFFAKEAMAKGEVKKVGFVIEDDRKAAILNELQEVDPGLLPQVQGLSKQSEFTKAIDQRINTMRDTINQIESRLKGVLARQKKTVKKGGELVEAVLSEILELEELFSREAKYFEDNIAIRDQIKNAMEQGTVTLQNIDQYIGLAHRLEKNTSDVEKVLPQIQAALTKLRKLRDLAPPIMAELEQEEAEIRTEREKVKTR